MVVNLFDVRWGWEYGGWRGGEDAAERMREDSAVTMARRGSARDWEWGARHHSGFDALPPRVFVDLPESEQYFFPP